MPPTVVMTSRTRKSCAECRRSKVKCEGVPCLRCRENERACEPQSVVVLPLHDRVQTLEDKVERLSAFLADGNPPFLATLTSEGYSKRKRTTSPIPQDDEPSTPQSPGHDTEMGSVPPEEEEADVTMVDAIRFGRIVNRRGGGHIPGSYSSLELVAFEIFYRRCAHLIGFIPPRDSAQSKRIQSSGSLLYWAMITVGSREASELQSVHHYAKEKSLVLSRETLFGRKPTMDDLQGLLVLYMWVMGVRLPGQAIAVAHELDLTATCGRLCGLALEQEELSPTMEEQLLDTMRTYAYLFQLDILSSMVAAKPKMLVSGDFAEYSGLLLRQTVPRLSDVRLAAQIELNKLISLAQEAIDPAGFSATPNRLPPRLDTISSYNDALDHWFDKWQKHISAPNFVKRLVTLQDKDDYKTLSTSIVILVNTSKLHINSFALRGLKTNDDLNREPVRFPYILEAARMAKLACALSNEHWSSTTFLYTSNLTQLQLTFSAVLLLRIIRLTRTWFDQQFIDEAIGEVQASASLLSELKGKYYSDNVKAAILSFQTWLSSRTPSGANSALPVGDENDRQLQDDYFFDLNAMGGLEMGWESFLDQQSVG